VTNSNKSPCSAACAANRGILSEYKFDNFAKIQIFLYKNANFPVIDCNACQNIVKLARTILSMTLKELH